MKRLKDEIVHFSRRQPYTIITTIDKKGFPHNSCKGIIKITPGGKIYILDLYKRRTYENLKKNHYIAVTAVDGHKFKGYCLKGKARIIKEGQFTPGLIKAWEKKINNRVTSRIIRNIHGEPGADRHPEILLPEPEYLIVMDLEEVIDLTPEHIKKEKV